MISSWSHSELGLSNGRQMTKGLLERMQIWGGRGRDEKQKMKPRMAYGLPLWMCMAK